MIGAFGTVTKGLLKGQGDFEVGGQVETIQTTALLRTARTPSVLENETHKLLWDYDIQTDHLISAKRPDLIVINKGKRTCKIMDFAVPADPRVK